MNPESETLTSRLIRRLSSRNIWSLNFLVFAAPFYALASLAFDAFRVNNFSIQWVLIGIVTFLEIAGLFMLVRLLTPKTVRQTKKIALINLGLTSVIGAIKNVSVAMLAVAFNLETNIDWALRIIGGAILLVCIVLAFAMFSNSRLEHQSTMERLQASRKELIRLRKNADREVQEQIDELIQETKNALEPKINRIDALLADAGATHKVIEQLRDLVRNQIRPYSHELQAQVSKLADETPTQTVTQKIPRTRKTLWPKRFSVRDSIFPFWTWIYVGTGELSVIYVLFGPSSIPKGILPSASIFVILLITAAIDQKRTKIDRKYAITFLVCISLLSSVITTCALNLAIDLGGYLGLVAVSIEAMTLILILGFGHIGLIDKERTALERRAFAVNQDLELELKLFEQALWLNRKRWSYALHGTVQATLTAAVTRLTQVDDVDENLIDLVRKDLEHVRETISKPAATKVELKREFADIASTWRGICSVHFDVTDGALKMLLGSNSTSMCVNEIVKEAVSNARRHGSAKNVWVRIQKGSNGLLHLRVENDGQPCPSVDSNTAKSKLGLGMRMFDELSLRWRMASDRVAGRTLLQMDIPVFAD